MSKKDFYQVSLKTILKNENGEILGLNGHPNGSFAGFYDLPGGRIDEDEFNMPFPEIIHRELAEEIGNIKISLNPNPVAIGRHIIPVSISGEDKDLHILYVFFEAKLIEGEIQISKEHNGFKWINLSKDKPSKFFKSGILEGIEMYISKTTKGG